MLLRKRSEPALGLCCSFLFGLVRFLVSFLVGPFGLVVCFPPARLLSASFLSGCCAAFCLPRAGGGWCGAWSFLALWLSGGVFPPGFVRVFFWSSRAPCRGSVVDVDDVSSFVPGGFSLPLVRGSLSSSALSWAVPGFLLCSPGPVSSVDSVMFLVFDVMLSSHNSTVFLIIIIIIIISLNQAQFFFK
jgi:hypothetical protein